MRRHLGNFIPFNGVYGQYCVFVNSLRRGKNRLSGTRMSRLSKGHDKAAVLGMIMVRTFIDRDVEKP
jgi:hypothetical protein